MAEAVTEAREAAARSTAVVVKGAVAAAGRSALEAGAYDPSSQTTISPRSKFPLLSPVAEMV